MFKVPKAEKAQGKTPGKVAKGLPPRMERREEKVRGATKFNSEMRKGY